MPEKLHDELQRKARRDVHGKVGPNGEKYKSVAAHRAAYVYGGMRNTGWKPQVRHGGNEAS